MTFKYASCDASSTTRAEFVELVGSKAPSLTVSKGVREWLPGVVHETTSKLESSDESDNERMTISPREVIAMISVFSRCCFCCRNLLRFVFESSTDWKDMIRPRVFICSEVYVKSSPKITFFSSSLSLAASFIIVTVLLPFATMTRRSPLWSTATCVATTATSRPWFSFSRLCDNASEVEPFFSLLVVSVIAFGVIVPKCVKDAVLPLFSSPSSSKRMVKNVTEPSARPRIILVSTTFSPLLLFLLPLFLLLSSSLLSSATA